MKKTILLILSFLLFIQCGGSDDREGSNNVKFSKSDIMGSWRITHEDYNGNWEYIGFNKTNIVTKEDNTFSTEKASSGIPKNGSYTFSESGTITGTTTSNQDNDFVITIDKDKKNGILDLKRKTTGGLQSFTKFKVVKL